MTLDKRGYGEVPPVRRSVSSFMAVTLTNSVATCQKRASSFRPDLVKVRVEIRPIRCLNELCYGAIEINDSERSDIVSRVGV